MGAALGRVVGNVIEQTNPMIGEPAAPPQRVRALGDQHTVGFQHRHIGGQGDTFQPDDLVDCARARAVDVDRDLGAVGGSCTGCSLVDGDRNPLRQSRACAVVAGKQAQDVEFVAAVVAPRGEVFDDVCGTGCPCVA